MKNYDFSGGLTFFEGQWLDANTPIMSGMSSGGWIASTVFDGLRGIQGTLPDGIAHSQRLIKSSQGLGHLPVIDSNEVFQLCWDAVEKFPRHSDLYIRPMIWADEGFIAPNPESTRFSLTVFEMEMPRRSDMMSAAISSYIRPLPNSAPTHTKAAGLYPNSGLAIIEARKRGFANAVLKDSMGNIAEFSASNLIIVKNGEALTPVDNGCFLCGITRMRCMKLLQTLGIKIREARITQADLLDADEVISTGNYAKVMAVGKIEDVTYPMGPVFEALYDAYMTFSATQVRPS